MKKVAVGILAGLTIAILMVAPAVAAKKSLLTEDELDAITAAGEPTVLIASASAGVATITNQDHAAFALSIPEDAQKGLRALTVTNVVGEVQLLVNLNVLSAQNDVAGTDQRNFSVQSWGATKPHLSAQADGVPGILNNPLCVTDCTAKANANIGVIAAPAQIQIASASGDVIIQAEGANGAVIVNEQQPAFALSLQSRAQVDLASLFIANIVGRAQAAYNINIAAATLNLIPATTSPFATPFANATAEIKQTNLGVQFRGTPIGVGNTIGTFNATLAAPGP